jgi:hypothetical protein
MKAEEEIRVKGIQDRERHSTYIIEKRSIRCVHIMYSPPEMVLPGVGHN